MADLTVDVDGLDASQQLLRDNIRRYLKEHVAPRIDQAEKDKHFPHEVLTGLADFGYFGGY
ncbi:MAG TPA: acyl-CoA dehydrogenase, partial [Cupriavidus sp.]|nr:acyl-CoA dehydrogenase [Cupriavidus sp.]